jgi:UDP-N-acetylglucosamine 3-dehydrogenase
MRSAAPITCSERAHDDAATPPRHARLRLGGRATQPYPARFPGRGALLASRDGTKAAAFNARLGGRGHFDSYGAAIESPNIDAVVVVTPPVMHLELTERALRAGKHVVVEKPPFLHAADVDRVEALAREAGRQVLVAENYFYKPVLTQLRRLIASGDLGELRFVRVNALKAQRTANWRDEAALVGGGALYEGGIHWVSFMANMGLTVESVVAHRPGNGGGLDRSMLLVFRYREGAVGTLHFSWETPGPLGGSRLSSIHGSRGSATFESNGVFIARFGARPSLSFPGLRDLIGYEAMFRDFVDAMRANRPPRYSLEHARRDLKLVEAAYASAGTSPSSST